MLFFKYLNFFLVGGLDVENEDFIVLRVGFIIVVLLYSLSFLIVDSDFEWEKVLSVGVFDILFRSFVLIFFVEIVVVFMGDIRGVM